MAETVQIIIEGKDQASGAFKTVAKSLGEVDKAAKSTRTTVTKLGGGGGDWMGPARGLDDLRKGLDQAGKQAATMAQQVAQSKAGMQSAAAESKAFARQLKDVKRGAGDFASAMGVAVPMGIAAAAGLIVKTTVELGNLGQQLERQEKYFAAFSGGAQVAAANLNAMRQAVGGALTDAEMMAGATKLLSMGLAKNGDDLAKLSRMAVMLGGSTRTATESMEEFALLLANQSILRLDTFGISGARVRERIDELQAATKGLSREQAFMQAVMEQGTAKLQQLESEGLKPTGTAADELRVAWTKLRDELAKDIAPVTEGIERGIAYRLRELTATVNILSGDDQIGKLRRELAALEQQMADFGQGEILSPQAAQALYDLQVQADNTRAAIRRLSEQEPGFLDWVGRIERNSEATKTLGTYTDNLGNNLDAVGRDMRRAASAADAYAAALDRASLSSLTLADPRIQRGILQTTFYSPLADVLEPKAPFNRGALMGQWAKGRVQPTGPDEVQDWLNRMTKAGQSAATEWQSAMEAAAKEVEGYVSSALNNAINSARDLVPGGYKGGLATEPGANGPFESVYRAMDVLKLGDASPWAKDFAGKSREQLQAGVNDFLAGNMSGAATALINVNMLASQVKLEQLAQQSREIFAQKIAALAGVDVGTTQKIVGGLLGVDSATAKDKEGKATGPVGSAVNTISTATIAAWEAKIPDFNTAGKKLIEAGLVEGMKAAQQTVVTTAEAIIKAMFEAMIAKLKELSPGGNSNDNTSPPPPPPTQPGKPQPLKTAPAMSAPMNSIALLPSPLTGPGIDYDRLGDAVASALGGVNVNMDGERVATIVRGKLQRRGAGGLGW